MLKKQKYIDIAERLKPQLLHNIIKPVGVVAFEKNKVAFQGWSVIPAGSVEALSSRGFNKGESFTLDFGNHYVGYFCFTVNSTGSLPDSPLRLKLIFGEMPCETAEPFDTYKGSLSRSWLQDEAINIDVIPSTILLPRRYSFRYVKIEIIEISPSYKAVISDISCNAVTSANITEVQPLPDTYQEYFKKLDKISLKTLEDCMQTVFEDGPKRDRRLWVGDLRLQALTNYYSFNNYNLVKRCLYLFAGTTSEEGIVPSCVYENPEPTSKGPYLLDYSLLYTATLLDYYNATCDIETLEELWPTALRQILDGLEHLDDRGLLDSSGEWGCFIDWNNNLDKITAMQAVIIYSLKNAALIASILSDSDCQSFLEGKAVSLSGVILDNFYDGKTGLFISGKDEQISWATQIWVILAGVVSKEEGKEVLQRLMHTSDAIKPNTPYCYHYSLEAMFLCGMNEEAYNLMCSYWGAMLDLGADTFWEVFSDEDQLWSPYNSHLINSYCHAWSCTPSYFIRKYGCRE